MANRWKFVEINNALDLWSIDSFPVLGTSFLSEGGLTCFYADSNPTSMSESNTSTIKEIKTIDEESIRVPSYRNLENKKTIKYDLKLEYQSEATYKNIKFLFNNGKKFRLYETDYLVKPQAQYWTLQIDDLSADKIPVEGDKHIYTISLKLTDMETDSSGNPIRWTFAEVSGSTIWNWTISGSGNDVHLKNFLTDSSPTSANEGIKKRGNDIETINGNIVRVAPIRIKSNGMIERMAAIKTLSIKLDLQDQSVKYNVEQLYNTQSEFDLFTASGTIEENKLGRFVLDDFGSEYTSVRGSKRLYGLNLSLREVPNLDG